MGDMLALGQPQEGASLLSGIVYGPYYLGTFLIAATIVWSAPQTWDWTRTVTMPKAATVLALFLLSVVMLTTQAFNPFIYFIF
jgi:alginate O-acetyltransferase complex protein AlgI